MKFIFYFHSVVNNNIDFICPTFGNRNTLLIFKYIDTIYNNFTFAIIVIVKINY